MDFQVFSMPLFNLIIFVRTKKLTRIKTNRSNYFI